MKRLLLVEDEAVIAKALGRLLERNHYEVLCATTVDEALAAGLGSFDLILADLRLPGALGTSLIPAADPVPVVIMTSHASVRSAVDAMRHGAIDYIAKPFDHDELLMIIERSLNQNLMQSQNRALKLSLERLYPLQQHLQGTELQALLNSIMQRSTTERFVHVFGEYGLGKESVAAAIHAHGPQRDGPFLVLDVGEDAEEADATLTGVPANMASEDAARPVSNTSLPPGGYLQAAQNGTLMIRHPEKLRSDTQRAIAQLVSGNVLGTGDQKWHRISNVNLVTISTSSIDVLVAQDLLVSELADLFVEHQFEVAALRRRPRDIALLANRHLRVLERRYARKKLRLSDDAMAALMANELPGNLADLESILSRAVFLCRTDTIGLSDLGLTARAEELNADARSMSLDEYFRFFILRHQSSLSETELAARLGISRKALWERRQKMNLVRTMNEDL